jgi:hyperosmotically inducible periplasmic protein
MKTLSTFVVLAGLFTALCACSSAPKSPDVTTNIRRALNAPNLKDVSASQDRTNGVVTLSGHVATDADRMQAESIAKSLAAGQVVSDQIAVVPPGAEKEAKAINSDLDTGIDKNVDAVLVQNGLQRNVKHEVKNGVVTLTGNVVSEDVRNQAQQVASAVPYVRQVVNELQVKDQKATSSN